MGCCQSTDRDSSDESSPRAQGGASSSEDALPHNSSRAAINQPSRSLSNVGSSIAPLPNSRPNQPIRSPSPLPTSPGHISHKPPPWTRSQLEYEREAYFDTRVAGSDEVWKGLRLVCEMVRKGDLAEAQGILDALNVTCPSGRMAHGRGRDRAKGGLYDERGDMYELPVWVLTDPEDIVENEKATTNGAADDDDGATAEDGPREEKGKGRAEDPGEMVRLRARLSDRAQDVTVTVGTKQKIAVAIRAIREQAGDKRIRLMYLGKTLKEDSTLEASGWQQGHVVNALVYEGDERLLKRSSAKR